VADSNPEPLIAALRKHKTVIDPTLALYELLARPTTQPIESFEPGIKKVARELETPLGGFGSSPEVAPMRRRQFDDEVALVGRLHRAGIPVVAGTDQSVPGHSLHRELELYVRAGFSPLEALQAATIVPATAMKTASDSGTIESGKLGDLIVLDGNPLDDIHNTRRIYRVITVAACSIRRRCGVGFSVESGRRPALPLLSLWSPQPVEEQQHERCRHERAPPAVQASLCPCTRAELGDDEHDRARREKRAHQVQRRKWRGLICTRTRWESRCEGQAETG
jgi:hypothetical protein